MSIYGNLIFDAQIIEDGVTYATPDLTFNKVADTGFKNIQKRLYAFAVYRVDSSFGDTEWRLYGTEGDSGSVTSVSFISDNPKIKFNDDDTEYPLDYYDTFSDEASAKEAMKKSYPVLGCRDPNARNFDETATLDDDSCIYDSQSGMNKGLIGIGIVIIGSLYFLSR